MSEQRTNQRAITLSWDAIAEATRELVPHVLSRGITRIIPVARGGLVPATILSYHTGIPILEIAVSGMVTFRHFQSDIMLLDEVCGSGETFRRLEEYYPSAWRVALYLKPAGRDICQWHVHEVPQDHWLCFPWGE